MYQFPEETVQYAEPVPEDAPEHPALDVVPGHLDFVPDDPAELRRAVTRMAGHINHADWRFIKLIAAMDRRRGWDERGYCNLGNWLDHRCGLGPCAARERIRIGRALARLPRIDAAFRDGILSYSKVRAITRVANRENEEMLLAIAGRSSAAELESLVRSHERVGASDRERVPSEARRSLSWHYEDGMVVITAAVPAERGALVVEALRKVVDARTDERDAHYESLLAGDCARVAAASDAETADPGFAVDPTEPGPAGNEGTNGTGGVVSTGEVEHPNGAAVAEPALVADGLGDVSARKRNARPQTNRKTKPRAHSICRRRLGSNCPPPSNAMPTRSWTSPSTTWRTGRTADGAPASATRWCSPSAETNSPNSRPRAARATTSIGTRASTRRTRARLRATPTSRSSSRMRTATC